MALSLSETHATGELTLVNAETAEESNIQTLLNQYTIKRHGACISFYEKSSNKLLVHFKPFDNTVLICEPNAYELANALGAKRFPIGNALQQITTIEPEGMQKFSRDREFPIDEKVRKQMDYGWMTLHDYLRSYDSNEQRDQLYDRLGRLYHLCADFSPGKQEEYQEGGAKKNMYCRFNQDNSSDVVATEHVLLNGYSYFEDRTSSPKIIGAISCTIVMLPPKAFMEGLPSRRPFSVYVYDEAMDYFSQLPIEINRILNTWFDKLLTIEGQLKTTSDNEKKALENERNALKLKISQVVEPVRSMMMAALFEAVRYVVEERTKKMLMYANKHEKVDLHMGTTSAFIRVTSGRERYYEKLDCSRSNEGIHVIHGPRTALGNLFDQHVKAWAEQELLKIQPKVSGKSMFNREKATGSSSSAAVAPTQPTPPPTNTEGFGYFS